MEKKSAKSKQAKTRSNQTWFFTSPKKASFSKLSTKWTNTWLNRPAGYLSLETTKGPFRPISSRSERLPTIETYCSECRLRSIVELISNSRQGWQPWIFWAWEWWIATLLSPFLILGKGGSFELEICSDLKVSLLDPLMMIFYEFIIQIILLLDAFLRGN